MKYIEVLQHLIICIIFIQTMFMAFKSPLSSGVWTHVKALSYPRTFSKLVASGSNDDCIYGL